MGGNGKDDDDVKDGGRHDVSRDGETGKTAGDIDPDKYGTDGLLAVTSGFGPGVAGWPVGCGLLDCHRQW